MKQERRITIILTRQEVPRTAGHFERKSGNMLTSGRKIIYKTNLFS